MDCDCVIIGAGPSGLHCGTYLGRFLRSAVIFHGGKARAEWIPVTHNLPGFPQGITGCELLRLLKRQVERYRCEIRRERVCSVEGSDGSFVVKTARAEVRTRKVILATGVQDIPPEVPDAKRFKGRTIRHCPVCDAYESRGKRVVVFGIGERAARVTLWLAYYTADLTLVLTTPETKQHIPTELLGLLEELRIPVIAQRVAAIQERGEELGTVVLEDGSRIENVFRGYSSMGLIPNSNLASSMGIALDSEGYIITDNHQQTSLQGVYAVGDVVSGDLGQLAVGFGHAATAATAIHNSLLTYY